MPRRREFTVFSLSFLDVMSCGFGATILLYLILDHRQEMQVERQTTAQQSEVAFLEREVRDGTEGLAELRNTIAMLDESITEARGRSREVLIEIEKRREELATGKKDTVAETEHLNRLKADVEQLEEKAERLRAEGEKQQGEDVRRFTGDGDRQYLTGLKLGGSRILVLLDRSASMLDHSLVNVLRLRNMPEPVQRRAEKWQRAVGTVDWLSTQLPPGSKYQIYAFNTRAEPVVAGSGGRWLEVNDRAQLDGAIDSLGKLLPADGTNLAAAFEVAQQLSPPPDNIYLITDGLPTQGPGSSGSKASGRDRLKYYNQALKSLPNGVPVNVILQPMEGDPMAASALWQLAIATRGAFLAPARDWP
jgi:von Willebrand factor type A domain